MLPNDSELLHLYLLAEIVNEKGTEQITPLPEQEVGREKR